MWTGSCAGLLSICLLKATPASSFGGALFAKPPASRTSSASFATSDATATSTATSTPLSLSRAGAPEGHARPSSLKNAAAGAPGWSSFGSGHRPGWALTAKYDTLEEAIAFARAQGGGDSGSQGDDGEQEARDSKNEDGKEAQKTEAKKPAGTPENAAETPKTTPAKAPPSKGAPSAAKPAAAKPAAKKSSGGGVMRGWNWGFKSTAAKKPSTSAAKPAPSDTDAKVSDDKAKEAEGKAKEAAAAKEKAAAAAAAVAKTEAEAKEEAKAAEEKKAADDAKAAEDAKIAEEEKAAAEAADAAAATAAAGDAAAAAKSDKVNAKEEEVAKKKAAADAAAAARAEKVQAKNEEAAQKKAATKAAADAVAQAKADAIKAKEDAIAQKKAHAKAVADAAAAAIADEAKAKEEEAAKKRAASAEAAAATAAMEKRAEEIAAIARGDEPKVEKKVTPKEAAPPAEDQPKKGKDDKEGKTKTDTAPARAKPAAAAPAPAAAAKPSPATAAAPAPAAAAAAAPASAAAKDAASGTGSDSADAPADREGGEVKKAPAKKAGGWGSLFGSKPKEPSSSLTLSKPETIVVVTGATGRVGQLAVRRILELYPKVLVRAVVNDFSKGSRLLQEEKDTFGIKLEIMSAELSSMRSAARVVEGASAVVFCASGYAQNLSPLQRLANAVRLTINPKSVTDVEGVKDVALALKSAKKIGSKGSDGKEEEESEPQPLAPNAPRFVLLSSAAVTRPNWSNEDKALYPLAADVPIVKLNPLNILTVKAEGEKELREVGIPYTVVRPCGLNDDHPRGRPLFSVGDTAAGRICREDVADVLVRCLGTAEATGKTFEVQSLPGLDKVAPSVKAKAGIDQALSNLPTDKDLEKDPNMLKEIRRATYPVLTQLRPVPLAQANRQQD